jgi:O-antigen/teichoic acid export membrane protein
LAFSLFPSNHGRYLFALLRLHAIFCAGFAVLAGGALVVAPHLHVPHPLVNAFMGFLIATPCVMLFWLARCFAYLEFAPGKALAGSIAYFAVLMAGLLVAWKTGGITPLRAFVCSACAAVTASVSLLLRYRDARTAAGREPSAREVWVRHWKYGRWGLGTVGMSWAQTNSVSFTSGYFLGLSGIGGLNALVGLLLPMFQVLSAASRLTLPRVAQRFTLSGAAATKGPVRRVAVALTGLTTAYWLVMVVAHTPLLRLVYGERFVAYAYLIPFLSIHLIAWGIITACDLGFNSMQMPRASFHIKLLMVALTVPLSTVLAWRFGLPGAAVAVPVCSSITAGCMAVKLRRVWRRPVEAAAGVAN